MTEKFKLGLQKFRQKKGATQMWWIIVAAILALLVVIFMVIWFRGSGERSFDVIDKNIEGLNDKDGDNVADMFDKCPDNPSIGDEFPEGITSCPGGSNG